jgi:hypothetical protein
MAGEERELQDLLKIKRRRLTTLRKQIAQYGYSAPAELTMERDELEQEIGASTKVIDPIVRGELPDDIMAALRAYGVPASINNALQLVESALYDLRKAFDEHKQELHSVKDVVMPLREDVKALKKDNDEGKRGRSRNFKLFLAVIGMLVVVVAVIIPMAVRVFGGA